MINVEEGLSEMDFLDALKPAIEFCSKHQDQQMFVLLDEVNTTSSLWTAKDLLCDHICGGVRIPENVVFIAILNPWKGRTEAQQKAIQKMDVGGLDFMKYQQSSEKNSGIAARIDLVYHVHQAPESLYSLVWDWGSPSQTFSPFEELPPLRDKLYLAKDRVNDELLMSLSMINWLVKKLKVNVQPLKEDFRAVHDATEGEVYWPSFSTLLLELFLFSNEFLRYDVYCGDMSVVSLREIRKACELIWCVFHDFLYRVRAELERPETPFLFFDYLNRAVKISLINTYCLRLNSDNRSLYLRRIQSKWNEVRKRFPDHIHPNFFPFLDDQPRSFAKTEIYGVFDELARYILKDFEIESGIVVNQALKENSFALLCAVYTNSTLFIVGRPGSSKSRSLELLVRATEDISRPKSFFSKLGIRIQKHVIQCSPDTTAHHVHANARRAALAQISANKVHMKRINVIVLEEVGATIGSCHNPLMSLHSRIDHGIELPKKEGQQEKRIRLPIVGLSNYRLDASKMGRARNVYIGDSTIEDLVLTAHGILQGKSGGSDWIERFAIAFDHSILKNDKLNSYYGMRDYYAFVDTLKLLLVSLKEALKIQEKNPSQTEMNPHSVRWAVMICLMGFPDSKTERVITNAMINSLLMSGERNRDGMAVMAQYAFKSQERGNEPLLLCECCFQIFMYRKIQEWQTSEWKTPHEEELTEYKLEELFRKHSVTRVNHQAYCQFNFKDLSFVPAPEVISYSLQQHSSRHIMIFTKANAALFLLFSLNIVRKEFSTVIFQSSQTPHNQKTSTSELIQQMMRIKGCLREGGTLILVKSRHLYESLLDALNVHYTIDRSGDGILHRTVLSMAGVTKSVLVQPTFRCIVIEDQDEVCDHVLPPMIGRFNKTILTYESALTPSQRLLREKFHQRSVLKMDEHNSLDILKFLIPGLTQEGLDSAIYSLPELEVHRSLCLCFSRKNLRRLLLGLVEGCSFDAAFSLAVSGWDRDWKNFECNLEFNKLAAMSFEVAQHLLCLTEQIYLDPSDLKKTFTEILAVQRNGKEKQLSAFIHPEIVSLNQATMLDVEEALKKFKLVKTDQSSGIIFVLDATSKTQSVQLDSLMYSVLIANLPPQYHVILIVLCPDPAIASTTPRDRFSLMFDLNWGTVFADEVVPRSFNPPGSPCATPHPDTLLHHLEQNLLLHEVLTPALMKCLLLQKTNLTLLCQGLSRCAPDVKNTMVQLNRLFQDETFKNLQNKIFDLACKRIEEGAISFNCWSKIALCRAKYSDSLRMSYLEYLGAFLVRILLPILGQMVQFNSLGRAMESWVLSSLLKKQLLPLPISVRSRVFSIFETIPVHSRR